MTQEAAHRFLAAVQQEPALQARLQALRGRDSLARLTQIAEEAGYSFTEEEYRAAVAAEAGGELSDEAIQEAQREMGLRDD